MIVTTSTSADLDAVNLELKKLPRATIYVKFATTAATAVAAVTQNFRRFRIAGICWAGACASDETLAVDDSVHTIDATYGVHTATTAAGGQYFTIQFIRTGASKTSGLGFFVEVVGIP